MSKKYVPSGYQIISIDVSDKTSGTPFTPVTEDEKLLHEILSSEKYEKPILLFVNTENTIATAFAVYEGGGLSIKGGFYSELIEAVGTQLQFTEVEL